MGHNDGFYDKLIDEMLDEEIRSSEFLYELNRIMNGGTWFNVGYVSNAVGDISLAIEQNSGAVGQTSIAVGNTFTLNLC